MDPECGWHHSGLESETEGDVCIIPLLFLAIRVMRPAASFALCLGCQDGLYPQAVRHNEPFVP